MIEIPTPRSSLHLGTTTALSYPPLSRLFSSIQFGSPNELYCEFFSVLLG